MNTTLKTKMNGLSLNTLKTIAIFAMVIDHTAVIFLDPYHPLYAVMRFLGRITGPTMFFAAVEGYHHTRDLKKYLARLLFFAVGMHLPVFYLRDIKASSLLLEMDLPTLNVFFTIFFGVLAITVRQKIQYPILKIFLLCSIIIASIPADWGVQGVVVALIFDYYYGQLNNQLFGYLIWVLFDKGVLDMLTGPFRSFFETGTFYLNPDMYLWSGISSGTLLPYLLLHLYNGKRGRGGEVYKWFFYLFYPLHLAILGLIYFFLYR